MSKQFLTEEIINYDINIENICSKTKQSYLLVIYQVKMYCSEQIISYKKKKKKIVNLHIKIIRSNCYFYYKIDLHINLSIICFIKFSIGKISLKKQL